MRVGRGFGGGGHGRQWSVDRVEEPFLSGQWSAWDG